MKSKETETGLNEYLQHAFSKDVDSSGLMKSVSIRERQVHIAGLDNMILLLYDLLNLLLAQQQFVH